MNDTQLIDQLGAQIEKFAKAKIEPNISEDDEKSFFRKDIFHGLGELGLCGTMTKEKYGGGELNCVLYAQILQKIAYYSVPYAVTLSVSQMCQSIIENFAVEDLKKKWLPLLASGKEIGSFALSETGSGSDAKAMKTSYQVTNDHYILNGSKFWITSAGESKIYVVMAKGEQGKISAFLVEEGTTGLSVGKKEEKMGWRTSPTCEIILDNVKIPKTNILGRDGDGLKVAFSGLTKGRVAIGAVSVGLAERAFDEALKYTLEREQFGQKIFKFQGLQFMLADMKIETESAKFLVKNAAEKIDQGEPAILEASIAKCKASDVAMKVTTDSVQLHGGVGYTKEFPVERLMRDAKVLQIVEGTNQIQRVVISRELEKLIS